MIQKTYFSLLKATQSNRVHPREVAPPGLVRARNFIPSQSDLSLTLRPDVVGYSSHEIYTLEAFQTVENYLNAVVFSQKTGKRAWITRIAPTEEDIESTLCSTYSTGTVTSSSEVVEGSGTAWLANVWPHCWITVDSGTTYYRIKSVSGDGKLECYEAPGTVSGSAYTILRTHDYERADFPIHSEPYVNSLIYNSVSPTTSDHSTTISGPFRSSLESSTSSGWTQVSEQVGSSPTTTYELTAIGTDGGSPEVLVAAGSKYASGVYVSAALLSSSDGLTWTERIADGNEFADVKYVNSKWIAVGWKASGVYAVPLMYTSPDGINWTQVSGLPPGLLRGVTYGCGMWVVGNDSGVLTSTDGTTWTARSISGILLRDVAWNGTYFVGVGSSGNLGKTCVSTDGINWTVSTYSTTTGTTLESVAWDSSASKWVLCGYVNVGTTYTPILAYAASAAASWTAITLSQTGYLLNIAFNSTAGYCVAVGIGGTTVPYAPVPLTYKIASGTTATAGTYSGALPRDVTYALGQWCAVAGQGLYLSGDGVSWGRPSAVSSITYRTAAVTVATGFTGFEAFGTSGWMMRTVNQTSFLNFATNLPGSKDVYGSVFGTMPSTAVGLVLVGKDGLIATSTNGLSWTAQTSAATDDFYAIVNKDDSSRYVAVGEGGIIYSCDDDGVTWAEGTTANPAKGTITFTGLPSAGQTFTIDSQTFTWVVSGTATGNVVIGGTADECVTNVVTSVTRDLATVTAADGAGSTVVVTAATPGVAGNSIVFVDVDSANMTVDGSGTLGATQLGQDAITKHLYAIGRNTSMYCAVGEDGTIITSADGILWTAQTSGTAVDLKTVTWGGTTALWVALGVGVALYSSDGISWSTSATDVSSTTFTSSCTDATNYLAAGEAGKVWSSADGQAWTERTSGQSDNFYACTYTTSGTDWWLLGASGIILKADSVSSAWIRQSNQLNSNDLYDIASSGADAVAVGANGTVYRVVAGVCTRITSAPAVDFYGVATDATTWVFVGANGSLYTTTDFATWTQRDADTTSTLYSVCWDGTEFVAVGVAGVTTHSADGTTWAAIASGGSDNMYRVRSGDNTVVATVGSGGETYYTEDHGATWTAGADVDCVLKGVACDTSQSHAAIASVGTMTLTGVPVLGETFVVDSQTFTWVVSRSGAGEVTQGTDAADCVTNIVTAITADLATVTATDGSGDTVVVTAATAGAAGNSLVFTTASTDLTMDGSGVLGGTTEGFDQLDVWLVVSEDGRIYRTDDKFTTLTRVDSSTITSGLSDCFFTGTHFYVIGNDGSVYYASSDNAAASTWTKLATGFSSALYGGYLASGKVYLVGSGGLIITSTDASSVELFQPLSNLYRANVFAVVDGYVVLFGTSEYNSTTKAWEWQRRRIRWTAPGTYNDFETAGQAGFADVFGEGNYLDARTLGHSIIVWESSNVSILSQTGFLDAPWDYKVIDWSNRMISNPLVVNNVAYWIEASGLLYYSDGTSVQPVPCAFDLTSWSDYDSATPVWLAYDETSGCIIIFQPVTSGTSLAFFYSPVLDVVTEITLSPADTADTLKAKSIVCPGAGQGVPTMLIGHTTHSGYPYAIRVAKLNYGAAILGYDEPFNQKTYWHGEVQTGFLRLAGTGQKTAVRALVAKTYQDAATMRWAFSGRGSDEDSWSGASDTNGTISLSTTAMTGSGTIFSALLGTSTGTETVYTGAVVPAWAWNVVVTNGAGVVQTTPAYTVTAAYQITFGEALTSGWRVYAYWDADPSPIMAVGDLIETTQGFHEVASITNRAAGTCVWYPSTTLTGKHWHADTPASGEKEAYSGFPLLVDSLQARIIVVPTASSTATKVKLLGFEVHHQAAGPRQMVR